MTQNKRNYILKWAKKIKAIRLLGGSCEDCGCNDIYSLDFHHKNPEDKEFQISLVGLHRRWGIIEKEVKKCILLCRNCHITRHFKDSSINRQKMRKHIFEYKNSFSCQECGHLDYTGLSLDLHHKKDKSFDISQELSSEIKRQNKKEFSLTTKLIDEIDKCTILCRNCHVKKHIDFKKQKEYKDLIESKILNMEDRRRLTESDIDKVIKLREQGLSARKICNALGFGMGAVEYLIYRKKR